MTKQEREAILDESRAGVLVIVLAIVGAIYMLNGLEPIRYGDPSVDNSVSTVPSRDTEDLMQWGHDILHNSPAPVKASITSASAAGSRSMSAMVSWMMRLVMANHSLRVAKRGQTFSSRTGACEKWSMMFGIGIGIGIGYVLERIAHSIHAFENPLSS